MVEAIFKKQEEKHVDNYNYPQPGQHIAQEAKGVVTQRPQPGHNVVHVIEGEDGDQQQEQNAQIRQAAYLGDHRFHLIFGTFCPRLPGLFFTQKIVKAGDNNPHKEGEDNGKSEGHKDVFPPGESRLHPMVFIIRSPQDHHDKNDNLQDPDELQVVEEKLLTIGFGKRMLASLAMPSPPWG